MAMLESMRYLERRRGSGVFLSSDPASTSLEALVLTSQVGLPLSQKANQDSIEVRRIIEVQAVQLACERRTDASLDRIRAILDGFDRVQDEHAASDYDGQFHLELVRSTGNEILTRLVLPFFLMSRNRREMFFTDDARRRRSHSQHLEIFDAIKNRDSQRAVALMADHIGRVDDWFHRETPD
jgi:DNA-binding FadR family transcriptional regulator